jgi:hypothetical protein
VDSPVFLLRDIKTLFEDPKCYGLVEELKITKDWYDFLFKKLGADLPQQLDVHIRDGQEERVAGMAWG